MSNPLGVLTPFTGLTGAEQNLVLQSWTAAERSVRYKLSYRSKFPVGAVILAANEAGETKVFSGCNVENRFLPATICAERNTGTTAVYEGYTKFLSVAIVCPAHPGGPSCGLCRQMLVEFGREGTLLNVMDRENNVRRIRFDELLPRPVTAPIPYGRLDKQFKKWTALLQSYRDRSHVPYTKSSRGALFVAKNEKGQRKVFGGCSDENASYGGSALAEAVAMRSARAAGYDRDVSLLTTVDNYTGQLIEGEVLQILREFGPDGRIYMFDCLNNMVASSLEELLPDSFGPPSLAPVV